MRTALVEEFQCGLWKIVISGGFTMEPTVDGGVPAPQQPRAVRKPRATDQET
jgi:hypothetical protein